VAAERVLINVALVSLLQYQSHIDQDTHPAASPAAHLRADHRRGWPPAALTTGRADHQPRWPPAAL